jgi:hypothetical protein
MIDALGDLPAAIPQRAVVSDLGMEDRNPRGDATHIDARRVEPLAQLDQ